MNTVVIVDNSKKMLDNYARMLEVCKEEITCKYFKYPENAVDYIRQEGAAVLVCELDMPVMSGKEVFDMVEIISPDTVKIAMSQVTDVHKTLEIVNQSRIFKLILKPFFFPEDIVNPIKEALGYYKHQKRKTQEEHKTQMPDMTEEEIRKMADELEEKRQEYYNIYRTLHGIIKGNLQYGAIALSQEEKEETAILFEGMLWDFMRYYMFGEQNYIFHINYLMNLFHCPDQHRVFQMKKKNSQEIPNENLQKIAYTIFIVGYFSKNFLEQYEWKTVIESEGEGYVLEVYLKYPPKDGKIAEILIELEEQMIHIFADRTVRKVSEGLLVEKIYYEKGEGSE